MPPKTALVTILALLWVAPLTAQDVAFGLKFEETYSQEDESGAHTKAPTPTPSDGTNPRTNDNEWPIPALVRDADRASAATGSVGMLGDPRSIKFRGVESFSEDQVRGALARDLEFQVAARPSASLSDFLEVLERRVAAGYARAGIVADVKAIAGSAIVVVVQEREPVKFGDFVAAPGANLPEGLLDRIRGPVRRPWRYFTRSGLVIKDTDRANHSTGEPCKLDAASQELLKEHLLACYADFGLVAHESPGELRRRPGQRLSDLVLTDEGATPKLKIGDIQIEGLTRHSREEVLAHLELAEGDPLTAETLQRVYDRLARSCRFLQHDLAVQLPTPHERYGGADARIHVRVREDEGVPRLGEPLAETDEILLRTSDWLARLDEEKDDIVVEVRANQALASFVISPSANSLLVDAHGSPKIGRYELDLNHALIVEPGRVSLIDLRTKKCLVMGGEYSVHFELSLSPTPDDDKPYRVVCGVGLGKVQDDSPWKLDIRSAALPRLGRSADSRELADGVLTLRKEDTVTRIDAQTGRIMSVVGRREESDYGRIELSRGEFGRRVAAIRAQAGSLEDEIGERQSLLPLALFGIDQVLAQPSLAEDAATLRLLNVAKQSLKTWDKLAGENDPSANVAKQEGRVDFDLSEVSAPGQDEEDEWAELRRLAAEAVVVHADRTFERGSWPWTCAREIAFDAAGNSEWPDVWRELARVRDRSDVGPLSCTYQFVWGGWTPSIAARGLRLLDEEHLLKDLRHFTEGDLWAAKAVESFSEAAAHMSEEDRKLVLRYTPSILQTPVTAILRRRATSPDEPPREAVTTAILDAWRDGWREEVKTTLEACARAPNVAAKPRTPESTTGRESALQQ